MVEYTKVNVKLSNTQLKKLKDAVKNNTRATLRIKVQKCLMKIIYHMNYYSRQDKKQK